jgi:hypothetical protein
MGNYYYGIRKGAPVVMDLPGIGPRKVYRMEYIERDNWNHDRRSRIGRVEAAWEGEEKPDYFVWVSAEKGRVEEGDGVFRAVGGVIYHDGNPIERFGEAIGFAVRSGRGWRVASMHFEEKPRYVFEGGEHGPGVYFPAKYVDAGRVFVGAGNYFAPDHPRYAKAYEEARKRWEANRPVPVPAS